MLEHHFLRERPIRLPVQQSNEVTEQSVLLQPFAHDDLALVHAGVKHLAAERFEDDISGRGRNEAENLGGLHHFEQIAEFEIEISRDFVPILAPAAIVEQFEQAEHPRHAAIRHRRYRPRWHHPRSSISENTLSVHALNASVRRSRGRGISTLRSAATRPGPDASTMMRSASSIASSIMCVTMMMFFTGMSGDCQMSSISSRSVIAVN